MSKDTRFIFVVSTSGSVMNQVLESEFLRKHVHSVVASEDCPAVAKAVAHGVPTPVFSEGSNDAFCECLSKYMRESKIDYVLSFYTQFYSKNFRDAYSDRIINFHPSLLPAFKGMDGFGDGVAYHAKIMGTTVEFIKEVMDEGKIVMQTACVVNPDQDVSHLRHTIFIQQCKTLLQVAKWIVDDRVQIVEDKVSIRDAHYDDLEFAPSLDFDEALNLNSPEISS